MKRLSFILFALIFIPLMGVARAQGGGTIVVSEKAPSILVHYEQPPSGWVSTGADVHSWILFKNTHPWYEIGYNTSYDGADSPAYDVTEISEMFHFEMYKDDYTYVDIDYGDAHHGKINLRTEINGETLSKNSLRDYVQLHFPAYEFLEREITIDGYDGSFDQQGTWKEVMELDSLTELIDLLEVKPIEHQPGKKHTYGLSTAVMGRAIEILSGQPFDKFLEREIFKPLGMEHTRFYLTEQDRGRFQPLC